MPLSSGSYNFQSITAEVVIRQAYELIGILGDLTVAQQLDSAIRSINFILTDWSNRNINLWTLKQDFITLVPGVKEYALPIQTQKVIQCELRTSIRQSIGEGGSYNQNNEPSLPYEGQVDYIFGDDPLLFCQQSINNGYFSFDYGVNTPNIITFVGIQSNVDVNYTISIDGSSNGLNWFTLRNLGKLSFQKGNNLWFSLDNILPFRFYRIKENGGETLNIQKIYFNNMIIDNVMTEVSRYEYLQYPRKNILGRPTIYYVDYQIIPKISIWQNPNMTYNCISYSAQQMIQTVTAPTQSINIVSAFYQSLVYGLARDLAQKYAPDRVEMMNTGYEQSLQTAITKNTVEVPFTFGVYSS